MKPLNDIPIDLLRERFEYAPELGGSCLRWRQDRIAGMGMVKCKAGTMAGTLTKAGYWLMGVEGRRILAHRVVYAINTGIWPEHQIDHIDRNKLNNRIENLRAVTHAENAYNRGASRSSGTGVRGVHLRKDTGKYCVQIKRGDTRETIGCYSSLEEASKAYTEAKERLHVFSDSLANREE